MKKSDVRTGSEFRGCCLFEAGVNQTVVRICVGKHEIRICVVCTEEGKKKKQNLSRSVYTDTQR